MEHVTMSWRTLEDPGHAVLVEEALASLGSPMPKGQLGAPNHFWNWGFHSSISWAGTGKGYP